MMHNPAEYPDPDAFKPERFLTPEGELNPNVMDPNQIAFGFGRRCVYPRTSLRALRRSG